MNQPPSHREQFLERPLPSSEESERAIIGSILMNNSVLVDVLELGLKDEMFYGPLNRRIFSAMVSLSYQADTRIDPITIGEELKKEGSVEAIGGVTTITNMTLGLPHLDEKSIRKYVEIIMDKFTARTAIRSCNEIVSELLEEEEPLDDVLQRAETTIFQLTESSVVSKGFSKLEVITTRSVERMETMSGLSHKITGISSGFEEVDDITLGWQDKDYIIVAARPSMGKTALALDFVMNAAVGTDRVIPVFSLEMGEDMLVERMICNRAKVTNRKYRLGALSAKERADVYEAKASLDASGIVIDDTAGISPDYMRAKMRRLVNKVPGRKIDMFMVDYLQLMYYTGKRKFDSRQQEITLISAQMKELCKEFNCPGIALSQLTRAPEARKPPKPMMSDLRESGSIEQDADVVAFIFREDYYRKDDEPDDNVAEIIFAKNRNGPTDTVRLRWDRDFTKFQNLIMDM